MSFFIGGGQKAKPQYTGIQLQTSSSTLAITLLWGMNRIAPNIVWYGDFQSHKQKQKAGKGFGGAGSTYTYSASLILGLCQGEIGGIGRVFRNQDKVSDYTSLGFSLFTGAEAQSPWGYLTTKHPDKALSYSGLAYVAAANYDLGSSASTPQHGFEVQGKLYNTGPLLNGDADAALVIEGFLTNSSWGVGLGAGVLDLDQLLSTEFATSSGDGTYQTYCRAMGFGINPALSSQEVSGSIIDRWTQLTNTAVVWTGYSLKLIPWGTEEVTGNGYKFVPVTTPVYTLGDDHYIAPRGEPPIKISRSDPADANNSLKLIARNRDNEYNDAPVEWKDQGLIDLYGLIQGSNLDAPEICSLDMAATVVSLVGQRLAYGRNTYEFVLPPEFCRLEPMDILIAKDPLLGEVAVWVDQLEEGEDFSWRVTAKEIAPGVARAADAQGVDNDPTNTGISPGDVNPPLIFQPPLSLTALTPQVWAAVSGGDGVSANPLWGGAYIYVSTDGTSYQQIGQVNDASRQGKLSADLADFSGANPDTTHTLSVDLGMSGGILESVNSSEASRFATLCYVGGEYISFETATLTAPENYDLSTLYRGLYGIDPAFHLEGSDFARLDESIFRYNLPADYIGLTLYFKFQSFNIWGGGLQDLSDCAEYTFTPSAPETTQVIYDGGNASGALI